MTTLALGPVIGKIGGGRESQEIALTRSDQTITLGEGRWLLAIDGTSTLNGSFDTHHIEVMEGPTTATASGSGLMLYIAPLSD